MSCPTRTATPVWLLLLCAAVGNSTTSAIGLVNFNVLDPAEAVVEVSRESRCKLPGSSGGVAAETHYLLAAAPELPVAFRSSNSGAKLGTVPDLSAADDDSDLLRAEPRWGMKRFLLIVLLLGGMIRYLTSPAYRKFISEVLDPLSW